METPADFNLVGTEREEYSKWLDESIEHLSQDYAWRDIAYLLWERNDERYRDYADKLPEDMRRDLYQTLSHLEIIRDEINGGAEE